VSAQAWPEVDEDLLTPLENDAFAASAALANALGALPLVHPDELKECLSHIHELQKSILARAAYPRDSRTEADSRL
jgi:hypothetical protein